MEDGGVLDHLEIIQGQLAWPLPVILGHEGAGIVEAVGRDVSLVKPGDHVVTAKVEGKFLSKNAYTVYIIHAPLIVGLCWLLRDVSIYPLLKWAMVIPFAVGLCFLTSHFLVRRIPLAEKAL